MKQAKQNLKEGFDGALGDLREMRDEIRLKLHLAGMDAKDAFRELEPRLTKLEHEVSKGGDAVADALKGTAEELRAGFRRLRDQLRVS